MQKTTQMLLLKETSELLDELIPVVQRNIDALKHDPNPLVQHFIKQGVERHQQLLEKAMEIRGKLQNSLDSQEAEPEKTAPVETEVGTDNSQETKSEVVEPKEDISVEYPDILGKNITAGGHRIAPITVRMPNSKKIRCRYGSDTFIKVIEEIGIERVKALDLKCNGFRLVATTDDDGVHRKRSGNYYIMVRISPEKKIETLNQIANRLNIDMEVRLDRSPYY